MTMLEIMACFLICPILRPKILFYLLIVDIKIFIHPPADVFAFGKVGSHPLPVLSCQH